MQGAENGLLSIVEPYWSLDAAIYHWLKEDVTGKEDMERGRMGKETVIGRKWVNEKDVEGMEGKEEENMERRRFIGKYGKR